MSAKTKYTTFETSIHICFNTPFPHPSQTISPYVQLGCIIAPTNMEASQSITLTKPNI